MSATTSRSDAGVETASLGTRILLGLSSASLAQSVRVLFTGSCR
jgi:hypothetical protein